METDPCGTELVGGRPGLPSRAVIPGPGDFFFLTRTEDSVALGGGVNALGGVYIVQPKFFITGGSFSGCTFH